MVAAGCTSVCEGIKETGGAYRGQGHASFGAETNSPNFLQHRDKSS